MGKISYRPGLEGVIAGKTAISWLNRKRDTLYYRGYDILDLAEHCIYEEVAYLLLKGELPRKKELASFSRELIRHRALPRVLKAFLGRLVPQADPMDILRTAVSLLGSLEARSKERGREELLQKSLRLVALIPSIVSAGYRLPHHKKLLAPKPYFGYAKNFLFLLTGKIPPDLEERAFDSSLILYAEHGFNASTFAARVTASTLSDLYSTITSAIGALKGPLHGGANEKAMQMLLRIGHAKRAKTWILRALARKERIMGFGHREYRRKDARHEPMKEWVRKLTVSRGDWRWFDLAEAVEEAVREEKGLFPNVDLYGGVLYYLLGIPIVFYTPIFAAARMVGWCAHVIEQLSDNRLIRPSSEYVGPPPRRLPWKR